MKKVYCILPVVVLISICSLCSCSKYTKKENNDLTKTNIETDTKLTTLFNEYSEVLDGKNSEKYASDLYDAYKLTTPENFINVLSNQEINPVSILLNFLFQK